MKKDNTFGELEDPLAAAQLEKLNLEIEELESNRRWDRRLASFIPLLSVLIAVAGFLFGIYQFQRQHQAQQNQLIVEQQKERLAKDTEQAIRIQNQIRSNVEQILLFPGDEQQTISKLSFLLQDLQSFLELNADKAQPTSPQNNKRSISATFATSVVNDCNFDQHRDVNYAAALVLWEDYEAYLREHPNQVVYILDKYVEAVGNLYLKDPSILRSIRFDQTENEFSYPKGYGKLNGPQIYHFQDIFVGFELYLTFVDQPKVKEKYLRRFQFAMCNGTFVEQYFGVKFKPQDYPDERFNCS